MANVDPEAGYKGITSFVVSRDSAGLQVGKKEDKLGIRASSTCELILDGVRVPKANVVGEPGLGYKIAIETLNEGRIGIGAQMVGIADGALQDALTYTRERQQFGRAIGEFQAVQFDLAQMATEIEAARLTVYNAARLKDAGKPFLTEAAMSKLFASQVAERVTSRALELFGGCRLHARVSRREALPGRKDRQDLRGNEQHAARDDRQADPGGVTRD